MANLDSDFTPLSPVRRVARSIQNFVSSALVLGGLFGGGATVGYYAGVTQEHEARIAEMTRMQRTHQFALESLSRNSSFAAREVSNAAADVASAAGAVAGAAEKVAAPQPQIKPKVAK